MSTPEILFSEAEIAARVSAIAHSLAALAEPPEILVGILAGAFVFTADLARALAHRGLPLPVEFLWLRSYSDARRGGDVDVLIGPTDVVRGKRVLLADGVLDRGKTLIKGRTLLQDCGASSLLTVVAVDKSRADALLRADYAAFRDVGDFIVGYGMDDGGAGRALPYIARVKT